MSLSATPLFRLVSSSNNVRKVGVSKVDDLATNIEHVSLLQNFTVKEAGKAKFEFE